jgi:hypothetical protein
MASLGPTLGGYLHVKVCVFGLISDREGGFPRQRRPQLWERASRRGQVHMTIDVASSFVCHTKGIKDLLHVDMSNIGADG